MAEDTDWAPPPDSLSLPGDEIHVWRARLDCPAPLVEELGRRLSHDEVQKAARFRFSRDSRRYTVTRGALRTLLARYLDVPPDALRFQYGQEGKPALEPGHESDVQFNVAHSHELALLAVTRRRAVGVDLEYRRPLADAGQIARRFFSPQEVAALRAAPQDNRSSIFFQIWTRKEAFIKATGKGLSQPLSSFDVLAATGERLSVVQHSAQAPGAPRWGICDLRPHPHYAGALVAGGTEWKVRCWAFNQAPSSTSPPGPPAA
jgi:4'-phosphopantetheinyl transferase